MWHRTVLSQEGACENSHGLRDACAAKCCNTTMLQYWRVDTRNTSHYEHSIFKTTLVESYLKNKMDAIYNKIQDQLSSAYNRNKQTSEAIITNKMQNLLILPWWAGRWVIASDHSLRIPWRWTHTSVWNYRMLHLKSWKPRQPSWINCNSGNIKSSGNFTYLLNYSLT